MGSSDTGSVMALRHFSLSKPITCILISGNLENFFTIRIKGPIGEYFSISKGDPIIFGKIDNNTPNIYGGFVLSKAENDITISPDMTSFKEERRKNARFPVSLLGYVKHTNNKESSATAWVKDISYEGIRICTESVFQLNDKIEISICIQNKVLNIEGIIIRRSSLFGRNEYGILMSFRYKNSVFSVRENIDSLVAQEKWLIENHLLSLSL